jgi:hypothetical protein
MRRAAGGEGSLDDPVAQAYVEKVRTCANQITDGDLDGLRAAGWSEDRIFELSIAAATGAARHRLDAALAAMAAAGPSTAHAGRSRTVAGNGKPAPTPLEESKSAVAEVVPVEAGS